MARKKKNLIAVAWQSLMGKVALVVLSILFLLAIAGPMVFAEGALTINTANIYAPNSGEHLLGTDELGRDVLSRVLYATRLSLFLAVLATSFGIVVGLLIGSLPWLAPKWLGSLSIAGVNIAIAFPSLLLALFAAVIFGTGVVGSVLAIGIAMVPWYARITQNLLASIMDREYVSASVILGQSRMKILLRHLLPNVAEPLIVNAMLGAGGSLLAFAGLSFLGIGIQPPEFDWGLLLKEGVAGIYVAPLAALAPALMVVAAGLGFNLLGEAFARGLGIADVSSLGIKRSKKTAPVVAAAPSIAPALGGRTPLLEVTNLNTFVPGSNGPVQIVHEVSFTLEAGQILGVVGESGSGKTLMVQSIAGLNDEQVTVTADRLQLDGEDILNVQQRDEEKRRYVAKNLGFVFQDPSSAFNPTIRIGKQISEVLHEHFDTSWSDGEKKAVERLNEVGVLQPEMRVKQYPHEFSGGMLQRAMIAMGMIADAKLLIADEPTTALDASIKHRILRLLARIRGEANASIIIISHDIAAILSLSDKVLVMYGGRVVEEASVEEIRTAPKHPYTRALLEVVPTMETDTTKPLATIPGRVIDFATQAPGCPYTDRCPFAMQICTTEMPPLSETEDGGRAACWLLEDVDSPKIDREALRHELQRD